MKNLIVYFSHAGENYVGAGLQEIKVGNANKIANIAQILTGVKMFEIETVKKYPFGYKKCCDVALEEQQKGELPELKTKLDDFDKFDSIILIYPCWWGTMPQAVFSFLNQYNCKNKQIFPICTHEGSGMGRSENDLKKFSNKVAKGLAIVGSEAEDCSEILKAWLKKNKIID